MYGVSLFGSLLTLHLLIVTKETQLVSMIRGYLPMIKRRKRMPSISTKQIGTLLNLPYTSQIGGIRKDMYQ